MDFLNIGGGELLVIVLLAIILFGPEDILKIMRTIGGYVRKVQLMWAQMSAGLSGEFITDDVIPEEIRETIKETQESVAALKTTLADIEASAKADIGETKAIVGEVETSLKEISTSVSATVDEVPKALDAALKTPVARQTPATASPGDQPVQSAKPPVETPLLPLPVAGNDAPPHTAETTSSEGPLPEAKAGIGESPAAATPLMPPPSPPSSSETHAHGEGD
jgi:sec-independent protein translocase protein TatB